MDNLTHTLVGLMLSRAGLNRYAEHASLVLMLSANAPDVDGFTLFAGAATYFHWHRSYTHAIVFIPIVAAAALLVARGLSALWSVMPKRASSKHPPAPYRWLPLYMLAIIGVASHLLLDYTNQYGIRLLLPFSTDWLALSITNVVDIWIWAILLLGVIAPAISGLVSSEIGARKSKGQGSAILALSLLLLYEGGRFVMHQRAIDVQNARVYDGADPRRVCADPDMASPLIWHGVVETSDAFWLNTINLLNTFDPTAGKQMFKPEHVPQMDAALHTQPFQDILSFSKYVYWRVSPAPAAPADYQQVEAIDLRFMVPPQNGFTAVAIVDPKNSVDRAWFHY